MQILGIILVIVGLVLFVVGKKLPAYLPPGFQQEEEDADIYEALKNLGNVLSGMGVLFLVAAIVCFGIACL